MRIEGLQMSRVPDFSHEPVMVTEVMDLLSAVPAGVFVDATLGGGGHAEALLRSRDDIVLLGIDRDSDALDAAAARLAPFGDRVELRRSRFGALADVVEAVVSEGDARWSAGVSGVLFDLGVSSPQLDRAERGFSLQREGPLDMRMDPSSGRTAGELVNGASEQELAALFAANGEGRLARRLARSVIAARPIESTTELAEVVSAAVPQAARRRGHPATRVFQALRIAVNEELDEVAGALPPALAMLAPGGRCLVIAYHSGEDRLVKAAFNEAVTGGCTCPPGLPCVCGARPEHRLVFRGSHKATQAEIDRNRRASSARLRAIERMVEQ
jgi:16S rRNA (cytosine1402-N4)-methyltransferase